MPPQPIGTSLKSVIAGGLDDSAASLCECLNGLTDEQFWAFPLPERNNIVTLVEHCIQILDLYACEMQGAPLTFVPEKRFDTYHHTPADLRPLMHDLPTVEQERQRIETLRQAMSAVLEPLSEEDLRAARAGCWWFEEQTGRTRADAYILCIRHTQFHLRQIWLMRGLLGLTDTPRWPG